jgi:DNA-binding CsgD family transcriptional regulator
VRRHVARADNPAWLPWRTVAARALARLGRAGDASSLVEEELERARLWGTPGPIGRALRVQAELAGGDEERLREAVDVLSGSAWRLERAKALTSLGRAVRVSRRPGDARAPLTEAFAIASSCGASALVREVRTELYATGARPQTAAAGGAGALTPSELRVATLAREGRTNREIAQALFVTPKTVEVHLSSAYRKLGIRSRVGLAAALA